MEISKKDELYNALKDAMPIVTYPMSKKVLFKAESVAQVRGD